MSRFAYGDGLRLIRIVIGIIVGFWLAGLINPPVMSQSGLADPATELAFDTVAKGRYGFIPAQDPIEPLPTDIQGYFLFPGQFLLQWRQHSDADTVAIFRCDNNQYASCTRILTLNQRQEGVRTATIQVQPHQFITFIELRTFDDGRSYEMIYAIPPFEVPEYKNRLPVIRRPT